MAKKEKRDVLIPYKFLPIFETLVKQGKPLEAAELTIAIIKYDMNDDEPTFADPSVNLVWESVIKPQLCENKKKYQAVSKARSEAVSTRYGQDATKSTNEYKCNNSNQMNGKNTIATDYDVDVDIDNDIDVDIEKEKTNKKEKDGWEEVFQAYDQRFPMTMSSYKAQQLGDIVANYGKDAVLYAIREANTGNAKQPIAYIRSVAMNYSRQKENAPKIVPIKKNDVQSGLAQALEILGVQDG